MQILQFYIFTAAHIFSFNSHNSGKEGKGYYSHFSDKEIEVKETCVMQATVRFEPRASDPHMAFLHPLAPSPSRGSSSLYTQLPASANAGALTWLLPPHHTSLQAEGFPEMGTDEHQALKHWNSMHNVKSFLFLLELSFL